MLLEHIFAYIASNYRKWEIARYGAQDSEGIFHAPKEQVLSKLQIFVDCIIFGFCINYVLQMESEHFHEDPYVHYWIVLDCMFTLLTLGYISQT